MISGYGFRLIINIFCFLLETYVKFSVLVAVFDEGGFGGSPPKHYTK